jgi:hypothetical protein
MRTRQVGESRHWETEEEWINRDLGKYEMDMGIERL